MFTNNTDPPLVQSREYKIVKGKKMIFEQAKRNLK